MASRCAGKTTAQPQARLPKAGGGRLGPGPFDALQEALEETKRLYALQDALQEALEETKRGSKDSINKLERKNRELQQTLQRLKEESDASTRREQVSLLFSCPIKWRVVNLLEN